MLSINGLPLPQFPRQIQVGGQGAANTTSGGGSLTVSDMNVSIIRAV